MDAGLEKPESGMYLSGRLPSPYRTLRVSNPIWIKYGIEAYFVEQGRGRAIEKRRGNWTDVQIPLEMEIAVSPGGKAVIRGYRWNPLGIGTHIIRNRPGNSGEETPRSATVQLTLANASDKPLAIVNLPDYCSFSNEAASQYLSQKDIIWHGYMPSRVFHGRGNID